MNKICMELYSVLNESIESIEAANRVTAAGRLEEPPQLLHLLSDCY